MKTYQAHITTQTLEINADNERQAEHKYNLWFDDGICPDCYPERIAVCGCVDEHHDVTHEMEEMA